MKYQQVGGRMEGCLINRRLAAGARLPSTDVNVNKVFNRERHLF